MRILSDRHEGHEIPFALRDALVGIHAADIGGISAASHDASRARVDIPERRHGGQLHERQHHRECGGPGYDGGEPLSDAAHHMRAGAVDQSACSTPAAGGSGRSGGT